MPQLSEQITNASSPKKQLNPRFDKMMTAYATAASAAAGVALLAGATPAEAKIVYTKTNMTITSSYLLDLNHDGIADFNIELCFCLPHGGEWVVGLEVPGNQVRENMPPGEAAALLRGSPIGSKQAFTSHSSGYGGVFMAAASAYGTASFSDGPWVGATNRYLGLKFLINGEVHFGWARMTLTQQFTVQLTGYAYETIPNKSLRAGQTAETADDGAKTTESRFSSLHGPSLGMLARGAEALEIWRRKEV